MASAAATSAVADAAGEQEDQEDNNDDGEHVRSIPDVRAFKREHLQARSVAFIAGRSDQEVHLDSAVGEFDCMNDSRRNGLGIAFAQITPNRGLGLHGEASRAAHHARLQSRPMVAGEAVDDAARVGRDGR